MSITKLTSRISTVLLERELLTGLMQNQFNLQRNIGKHSVDFFTSDNRAFIYEMICKYFTDKRAVFTREDFEFEIQKRLDPERDKVKIEDVTSEFDVIKSTPLNTSVDVIIAKLNEVKLANNIDTLVKEAYDELEKGHIAEAANLLKQKSIDLSDSKKEGKIINLHVDSDDWFEEVRNRHDFPEKYTGVPTGFEKFDKMTGGLFPAELTIVFGLSGKGKSTFMKAMSTNIRKQGRVVLHCGNEENEFQMRSKYMSADSGEKYSPFKRGTYTDEEYNRLKAFSDSQRNVGAIYVYEFPQQTDVTWIERAYRNLEMKGVKVDVIVVDYLDLMKPIQQAYNENDEQGKVTSDLKQLAINCNCPVITATQAGTQSEKQEKKLKPFLTAADVFGTKRKVHSANTLIGIVNQTATVNFNDRTEEERKHHKMVLCVPKNRDGALFTFRQVMDVECGKFYEDTDVNDPVTENLEKQAGQMMQADANGQVREEIDTKELMNVAQKDLNDRLEKIKQELAQSNGESKTETVTTETETSDTADITTETSSETESVTETVTPEEPKQEETVSEKAKEAEEFMNDAPPAPTVETPIEPEKKKDNSFLDDAPDAPGKIAEQQTVQVQEPPKKRPEKLSELLARQKRERDMKKQ